MGFKSDRGFELHTLSVTTDGSGAATVYSDAPVWGIVNSVQYVKTDFANGSTMTLTGETTGTTVWNETGVNASATRSPMAVSNKNTDGSALAYYSPVIMAGERLKLVIASGGATKTGTFYVTVMT